MAARWNLTMTLGLSVIMMFILVTLTGARAIQEKNNDSAREYAVQEHQFAEDAIHEQLTNFRLSEIDEKEANIAQTTIKKHLLGINEKRKNSTEKHEEKTTKKKIFPEENPKSSTSLSSGYKRKQHAQGESNKGNLLEKKWQRICHNTTIQDGDQFTDKEPSDSDEFEKDIPEDQHVEKNTPVVTKKEEIIIEYSTAEHFRNEKEKYYTTNIPVDMESGEIPTSQDDSNNLTENKLPSSVGCKWRTDNITVGRKKENTSTHMNNGSNSVGKRDNLHSKNIPGDQGKEGTTAKVNGTEEVQIEVVEGYPFKKNYDNGVSVIMEKDENINFLTTFNIPSDEKTDAPLDVNNATPDTNVKGDIPAEPTENTQDNKIADHFGNGKDKQYTTNTPVDMATEEISISIDDANNFTENKLPRIDGFKRLYKIIPDGMEKKNITTVIKDSSYSGNEKDIQPSTKIPGDLGKGGTTAKAYATEGGLLEVARGYPFQKKYDNGVSVIMEKDGNINFLTTFNIPSDDKTDAPYEVNNATPDTNVKGEIPAEATENTLNYETADHFRNEKDKQYTTYIPVDMESEEIPSLLDYSNYNTTNKFLCIVGCEGINENITNGLKKGVSSTKIKNGYYSGEEKYNLPTMNIPGDLGKEGTIAKVNGTEEEQIEVVEGYPFMKKYDKVVHVIMNKDENNYLFTTFNIPAYRKTDAPFEISTTTPDTNEKGEILTEATEITKNYEIGDHFSNEKDIQYTTNISVDIKRKEIAKSLHDSNNFTEYKYPCTVSCKKSNKNITDGKHEGDFSSEINHGYYSGYDKDNLLSKNNPGEMEIGGTIADIYATEKGQLELAEGDLFQKNYDKGVTEISDEDEYNYQLSTFNISADGKTSDPFEVKNTTPDTNVNRELPVETTKNAQNYETADHLRNEIDKQYTTNIPVDMEKGEIPTLLYNSNDITENKLPHTIGSIRRTDNIADGKLKGDMTIEINNVSYSEDENDNLYSENIPGDLGKGGTTAKPNKTEGHLEVAGGRTFQINKGVTVIMDEDENNYLLTTINMPAYGKSDAPFEVNKATTDNNVKLEISVDTTLSRQNYETADHLRIEKDNQSTKDDAKEWKISCKNILKQLLLSIQRLIQLI